MEEHFGYTPGDDYKLAGYQEISGYFRKLAASSNRIRLAEFGKSANGKPLLVAFISSPENLARLDHYRGIQRRLALGEAAPDEAARLSREGRAVVWIDSGLHATEVAPVQHAPHLAHRMLTGDTDEIRRILDNVILMQVPVINPDGLDWVVEWYRGNLKTPYELAPFPRLYQKYAGHDNNRDYFMLNLEETRHVARMLFREWYPHIVYNQHQQPAFPARIFIPPYAEPLNPNIPAPVMEGIHLIGAAMKERFAREDKAGVLSYFGFDGWWNGGLRSAPAFHNMHGILTETAASGYATPREYHKADFPERFANGMPASEPSIFYQRPWRGGWWRLRDAVDYMLTADFAILDLAAARPADFLHKSWETARQNIALGKSATPYAYVVPSSQPDRYSALEMLRRLQWSGLLVERAKKPFEAGGKQYPAGSWILPAAQPFRAHLVDLMEPQKYPRIRTGQNGPTKRPYDVAGWTLPMLMGVEAHRLDDTFQADLEPAGELSPAAHSMDHRDNSSYLRLAELLRSGRAVSWDPGGAIQEGAPAGGWALRAPRVAVYEPHTALIDAGWTQWVLDTFGVPYTVVRNADLARGKLRDRFDSVILSSQSASSILHGTREGEATGKGSGAAPNVVQRPEYSGGIGLAGLSALDEFVRAGGSLIAFDSAAALPVQFFPLPLAPRIRGEDEESGYYCPGSILRVTVDTSHPLAFGMPKDALVFSSGGQAWDVNLLPEYNKGEREIKTVARYAASNVLASGWLSGEKTVQAKPILIDARHGQGHVYLFGFRPQFRGQTFGTFRLVLNAIYLASARRL
jgi:hypothetical protein